MAYGSNPSSDTTDAVRLRIGDTSTTSPILADAEIDYFYTLYGDVLLAAHHAANAIAGKYAIQIAQSVEGASAQLNQIYEHYVDLAAKLLIEYNTTLQGTISAPSIEHIDDSKDHHFPPRQWMSDIKPQKFLHHDY